VLVARVLAVLALFGTAAAGCGPSSPQPESKVWAWGSNDFGQIGDGYDPTFFRRETPVRLSLSDVTRIAAGFHYSMALKSDGSVWQWGSLHRKVTSSTPCSEPTGGFAACDLTPTLVSGLGAKAKLIGAGADFALAVMDNNNSTVCRWGQNDFGQLGMSNQMPVSGPVCSTPPARVIYVDGGGGGRISQAGGGPPPPPTSLSGGHVLALSSGPPQVTAWTWGRNEHKQTGVSTCPLCPSTSCGPADCVRTPVRVPVGPGQWLVDAIGVSAGNEHSLALKVDGSVWAWGSQDFGQLGVTPGNVTGDVLPPIRVSTNLFRTEFLGSVSDIEAGGNHNLALKPNRNPDGSAAMDGKVWAWGFNDFGQVGVSTSPSLIQTFAREVPGLDHVIRIAAGDGFSLALKSDGTVWAWGRNDLRQLGGLSMDKCGPQQLPCSHSPIQVPKLTGVSNIAAGGSHALAITKS
jgi:alpha-tubulin suppressor-like RCC1 family protein